MGKRPGRNDPCPCGSGNKYKQCCLGKPVEPVVRPEDRRRVVAQLESIVEQYRATPEGGLARRVFWGPYLPKAHELADFLKEMSDRAFLEWLIFDRRREDGKRLYEHCLEQGVFGTAGEVLHLNRLARSTMRLYEVTSVKPGTSITIRDVESNTFSTIAHQATSRSARQWDLAALRLLSTDPASPARKEGRGLMLKRAARESLLAEMRERREAFVKDGPDANDDEFYRTLPPLFHQTWLRGIMGAEAPHSAFNREEKVEAELALFDHSEGTIRVETLRPEDGLPVAPGVLLDGYRPETRPGRMVGRMLLRWYDRLLLAEMAQSLHRIPAGSGSLGMVEGVTLFGQGARPTSSSKDEQVRQALNWAMLSIQQHHYGTWLDQEVPALEMKSPRKAGQSTSQRPRVAGLLRDMENEYLHSLGQGLPGYDPTWMWDELDLAGHGDVLGQGAHPPPLAHETMGRLVPGFRETANSIAKRYRTRSGADAASTVQRQAVRENGFFKRLVRKQRGDGSGKDSQEDQQRAGLLEYHLDCACNYELHYRKAFWVDGSLARMLGDTKLDLQGNQLRLPFSSLALVFTDRRTLGTGERLRASDPGYIATPRLLRVLTAYVTALHLEGEERDLRITFVLDALDEEWPYLVVRDLHLQPDARLDTILDSHLPGIDPDSIDPFFTSADLRRLVHLVINAIMYATSATAEREYREPPTDKRRGTSGSGPTTISGEEVFFLPGHIDISEERRLQELERAPGGGKVMKRFMVRGHWRRAAANYKDQRPRWIRPHWKGPDIATIIERQYRLKP